MHEEGPVVLTCSQGVFSPPTGHQLTPSSSWCLRDPGHSVVLRQTLALAEEVGTASTQPEDPTIFTVPLGSPTHQE